MRHAYPTLLLLAIGILPCATAPVLGQEKPVLTRALAIDANGKPVEIKVSGQEAPKSEVAKPEEKSGEKSGEAKSTEPKVEEPSAVKQRPLKPDHTPDPEELKARPNDEGKVRFNFRGQPWPDVLTWLAEVSEMSFDWQELPGDYLNLVTQRSYTIEEARDLINRHLLTRGYTMLENDELLTVVNVKKLDAGMVPRVEPKELMKRRPHEFVKVSFPLEWIVAESAVDELKPMLSPNGKLTSLKSTNRLEAMDAVVNLREIYKVIGQEQSDVGQEKLVREFDLQHAKATEVQQQLQRLLGIEEKASSSMPGRGNDQMQLMMQQQQEMMQQMQRKQPGAATAAPQKTEINLVVNVRRNSILARANPEKMAVIGQAIKMLDVPLEQSQTIQGSIGRMQVYRLAGLEPNALVKMLEESGGLDPTTRLQVDEKNKAIIAHASLADHMMIRKVIEKLDGSGRKFEVIALRKLGAEYVAGSIEFMFNGGNEEKQPTTRRGYDYDYGRRFGPAAPETAPDKFRVDADTENNRLLLWANDLELQEVRNLLIKLGEITDPRDGNSNASRVRVLTINPRDAEEWLQRLRRTWPTVAPNPLIAPEPKPAREPAETPATPAAAPVPERKSQATLDAHRKQPWAGFVRLAQLSDDEKVARTDESKPAPGTPQAIAIPPQRDPANRAEPPPVRVEIGPDGRLIISSQDTGALDLMEELAEDLAPERRDYQVFQLKYAPAFWVRMNLVEFFEEEDKAKKADPGRRTIYYFEPPVEKKERQRLSKKKQLKFISDSDTNTIVVINADAAQSKTITDLIELYDKPDPNQAKTTRVTSTIQIQYSSAKTVADAVKEVYRDLLSANDKALAQPGGGQQPQVRQGVQGSYIGEVDSSDSTKSEKRTKVAFKGKLSLGIDELSNTLLISADGEHLHDNVVKMVEALDMAARPTNSISVVKLGDGVNPTEVRRVLLGLLSDQPSQTTPRPAPGAQQRPNVQRNSPRPAR